MINNNNTTNGQLIVIECSCLVETYMLFRRLGVITGMGQMRPRPSIYAIKLTT